MVRKTSRTLEIANIFSSIVMIALLFTVLLLGLRFWSIKFPQLVFLDEKMFSLGIVIAVVTVISQWIQGRAISIGKSCNRLKILKILNKNKEVRNG